MKSLEYYELNINSTYEAHIDAIRINLHTTSFETYQVESGILHLPFPTHCMHLILESVVLIQQWKEYTKVM